jgi:hypothetical protein
MTILAIITSRLVEWTFSWQTANTVYVTWVTIVKSVVTPSGTLAGTASGSNQNETQETMTNIQDGI